jgi:hypothetical protein
LIKHGCPGVPAIARARRDDLLDARVG